MDLGKKSGHKLKHPPLEYFFVRKKIIQLPFISELDNKQNSPKTYKIINSF